MNSGVPRPPYEFNMHQLILVYLADPQKVRNRVPARFGLRELAGRHFLQVSVTQYTRWHGCPEDRDYVSYNETAWFTPVWSERQEGIYFFRLDVTDDRARAAGRDHYGFPKHRADVRFDKIGDEIWAQSRGREAWNAFGPVNLRVRAVRRMSTLDGLDGFLLGRLYREFPFLHQGLFVHGRQVVRARSDFDLSAASPCDVREADIPYLEREGLMRRGEASLPFSAMYVGSGRMRLESPVEM